MLRSALSASPSSLLHKASRAFSAESNLLASGITLPPPAGPKANYLTYKRVGNTLFLSGHLPITGDGTLLTGTVGEGGLTTEEGYEAARHCGLNLLSSIREAAGGSLDNVTGVTKLFGLVQSSNDFKSQHLVLNGCSDLMCSTFSHLPDKGLHSRSAVGVNTLPLDMPVEIEAVVELKPLPLVRLHTADDRMAGVVDDGETVWLSGQVPADWEAPLDEQVKSTLDKVSGREGSFVAGRAVK